MVTWTCESVNGACGCTRADTDYTPMKEYDIHKNDKAYRTSHQRSAVVPEHECIVRWYRKSSEWTYDTLHMTLAHSDTSFTLSVSHFQIPQTHPVISPAYAVHAWADSIRRAGGMWLRTRQGAALAVQYG